MTTEEEPIEISFQFPTSEEEDTNQPHSEFTKDEQELMYRHIRLAHTPFSKLIHMAKLVFYKLV
jgi:hypothetical protein